MEHQPFALVEPYGPSSANSSTVFGSTEGMESSILAVTFVIVVPLVAAIACVIVKMHRWRKRRRESRMAASTNENAASNLQAYWQRKAELDAEQRVFEVEAIGTMHELAGDDAMTELLAAHDIRIALTWNSWRQELAAEEFSKELGTGCE